MDIYRYRSMKSLLEFKELENQEIYLAKPEELNDPMEGMYWGFYRGDKDAWSEMFKAYFYYMFSTYRQGCDINLYFDIDDFTELSNAFVKSSSIEKLIECLSQSKRFYYSEQVGFLLNPFVGLQAFYSIRIWHAKKACADDEHIKFLEKQLEEAKKVVFDIGSIGVDYILRPCEHGIDATSNCNKMQEALSTLLFEEEQHPEVGALLFKCLRSDFLENYEKYSKGAYRIAAFSENESSASMWGLYAAVQNGVCMCFDLQSNARYKNSLKLYDNSYEELEKVNYIEQITCHDLAYDIFLARRSIQTQEVTYSEFLKKWKDIYLHKLQDWEFEKEWRLVLPDVGVGCCKIKYHFDSLKSVTFGKKVSSEDIYRVIDIIRRKCKDYNRTTFEFYQYSALGDNVKIPMYTIRLG